MIDGLAKKASDIQILLHNVRNKVKYTWMGILQ